jgi:hypothetical protein
MNALDDDIRKVLANEESLYDLEREEGVFRQMAGIYQGKMRWMAILATIESVVFVVLIVLAAIEFFQADDTKWQIFYATSILLLGMLLLLVKLWGWMQMNRNAIQREIKRLELRMLERDEPGKE